MRFRNASGERIRVDGQRMNAEDCCCDSEPCEFCDGGSMPSAVSLTFSGFTSLPWTYLNNTFVANSTGECTYAYDDDANPCDVALGGNKGVCIRVYLLSGAVTVRLGGVFPYLQAGIFANVTYGAWLFTKSFGGAVECTGTHALTRTQSQYNAGTAADCTSAASGSATTFDDCEDDNTTETPSCSVTF